jgi:hypothetical protein
MQHTQAIKRCEKKLKQADLGVVKFEENYIMVREWLLLYLFISR